MVDLNNNENPVQEPKAPVRSSKLKRFVPARDLNKRLDINSQGQVINSYAEIPTGSSTNNTNNAGTTNSGNTITATQNGGVGSEKWFAINLGGSSGATVNVNQGGAGINASSMLINCMPGTCGTYSFNRY
jgi:hypothetical protein